MPTPLSPAVLLALGLPTADAQETADTSDTAQPPGQADTGPCLSVQACLCTCDNGERTAGWMIPALGLLAARRRRRDRDPTGGDALDALPDDVRERLCARRNQTPAEPDTTG